MIIWVNDVDVYTAKPSMADVGLLACPPNIQAPQRNKHSSIHRAHDDAGNVRHAVPAHDRLDHARAVLGGPYEGLQPRQPRAADDLECAGGPSALSARPNSDARKSARIMVLPAAPRAWHVERRVTTAATWWGAPERGPRRE